MLGPKGVIVLKSDQRDALAWENTLLTHAGWFGEKEAQELAAKVAADKEVLVDLDDTDKKLCLSTEIDAKYKLALVTFLLENLDVFAWQISDMSRIPREVIEHKLVIDLAFKPIKQERRYTLERRETIRVEVNKLLEAGFIRPVYYPSWLANLILVEKPDRSWCMCIDYTSLNKSCPKDEYPLPHICHIVDSTVTCELLLFLDAYSSYHQISLTTDDEEKTSCITPFGIFCYTKMAFGLKYRGATYQKCVHIILKKLDWEKHRSLHWWYSDEVKKTWGSAWWPQRDLQQSP
jgi:hypothetical protein